MKKVLVAVMMFAAAPVSAQEICEDYWTLGQFLMSARQSGISQADMNKQYKLGEEKNESLYDYYPDGYVEFALREAYLIPIYKTEKQQTQAEDEFAERLEAACKQAGGNPLEFD